MKRKIFMRAAAMVVAAVMATGYLPEISPIFETAAVAYAADITQNTAIVINSSNKSTYNGKTITGTVPSSSYAGNQGTFISRGAIVVDGIELNLTIDGFNADYSDQYSPRSGISLVNGAKLHLTVKGTNNLTGGFGGAGISVPDGCTLEITAESTGTLNATGGESYGGGAGIGSNGNRDNTNKAIGDLYPQGLGDITINGGTINAQGGSWYDYITKAGGAAGIGSSEFSGATSNQNYGTNTYTNNITGNITINGGTVTAAGGCGASGIGGGINGTVKTINITGGNITSSGKDNAAAIGLGANSFMNTTIGTLTCPTIDISGGTVKANGNIGYGDVAGDSQNTGGNVAIGDSAAVSCAGTITPTTAICYSRTFNFTVYDRSLTQTVKNAEIDLPLGRIATADITVDRTGIGTAAVTAIYTNEQFKDSDTATVKFNNKTFTSESISLANANNTLVVGGYLYNFSGTIYHKNIALDTTASFTLDDVSDIFANAAYTPETAGTDENSGIAKFGGYFITPNELSGVQTFKITDSNNNTYIKDITFPAASAHSSSLNFSITDGSVPAEISYVDENNTEYICSSFNIVESADWGTSDSETWVVVYSDTELTNRPNVKGTVNLILCDNAALTAPKGISVTEGNTLNIYSQQDGTGQLIATAGDMQAGIGSWANCNGGNITIHSGIINAAGGKGAAGIGSGENVSSYDHYGGYITILGGNVTANGGGGYGGAGIGGGYNCNGGIITISGGTVYAKGGGRNNYYGAGIGGGSSDGDLGGSAGTISITGGNVTAKAGGGASGIGPGYKGENGQAYLKWTKASDSIYADSYGCYVQIMSSFMLKDTYTAAEKDNIGGKTIVPRLNVGFDGNGGTGNMSGFNIASGMEYTLPDCEFTAPENMVFDKWEINGVSYNASEDVVISNNTTIKAVWKMIPRTVTFNTNGHGTEPIAQVVEHGEKASKPEALTAEGYTFGGWYTDKNCTTAFDFGKAITEDTTLYAKWTADGYTISYDLDGGENAAANPAGYNVESEDITLAEPTKTGYSFTGWTYDGQTEPTKSVIIPKGSMGDKAYTANWQINQYTITFDTNGGSEVDAITQDYGTAVAAPDVTPTKPHAFFAGWENLPTTMPAENITVKAVWDSAIYHEAKEKTCLDDGNIVYYTYKGKYYTLDENDYFVETEKDDIFSYATGHVYGEPVWSWGIHSYSGKLMATMNIECTVCGRKDVYTTTEFETEIVKEPTATEEGLKKYTAVIDVDGVEFTDEYTEAIYRTSAVATIGDTPYYRLIDAINAVKSGDTITVLDDIDEPNVGYGDYPYIENDFTLDLNGHTVTAKSITTSNDLTLKNGTFSGYIINNSGDGMAKYAITLDNAAVNSSVFRWCAKNIVIKNGSTLNITDGEIHLGACYEEISLVLDKTSAIVLTNAEIRAGEDDIELKELTAAEIEKYFPAGYSLKYDEDNGLYYITNADGNKVTNAVELLAENFVVNKVEAKAATCEEDGCIEHYTDTHGNLYIEQNGAYIKENAENVIIPALGHSWGEPAYKWSADYTTCTKTYVCQNDSTHIKTKTVDTVIENGIATATFDKEIKKYSHTDNIDDTGKASEDYGVSLDTRDTVKIDGAKKLSVKLKYDTEPGWDFVYVYKNPDDVKPMTVTEGEEEVPLELSGEGEKTFEVDGDEVTFRFTSDESNVKYGYYAVVTATVDDVQIKEVSEISIIGDVNFDEKVDDEDAALVLKYISAGTPFFADDSDKNAKAIKAANFDGIGEVDMLDVIAILQKSKQA